MQKSAAAFAAFVLAAALTGPAGAVEVKRELVVDAPLDAIWAKIGEACSLKLWSPGVKDCTEKKVHGDIVRTITADNGGQFVEQIVASGNGFYSYRVLKSPLPMSNYIGLFAMHPDANDASKTLVTWRGEFDVADKDRAMTTGIIAGIYESGLAAIADYVKKQ